MSQIRSLIPSPLIVKASLGKVSEISHITDDSRAITNQSLFFAVRGSKQDGHSYVTAARAIEACVVIDNPAFFAEDGRTILVVSSREALAYAAAAHFRHPSHVMKVVGITGTNGKTTSAFLTKELWEHRNYHAGLLGTVETKIGRDVSPATLTTPGALQLQSYFARMVDAKVTHAVMEVSSIALDQHRVKGTRFAAGIFTNLTQDHLDYHGTLENYFESKKALFCDHEVGLSVVNADDVWVQRLKSFLTGKAVLSFSLQDDRADFFVSEVRYHQAGTDAQVRTPSGLESITLNLAGSHNLQNLLGVWACLYGLGEKNADLVPAFSQLRGAPGRLERAMPQGPYPHTFVDYAHTPDALKNVLMALQKIRGGQSGQKTNGKLICVFGCGGDRDRSKRPLMASIAEAMSDIVIVTSDNPRTEDPERILTEIEQGFTGTRTWYREVNRRTAIRLALSMATPEDIVLIAGKGHETYQILGTQTVPFDDREVVRAYYEASL